MSQEKKYSTNPNQQRIKMAVDTCIFTIKKGKLHVLLIQMKKAPYADMWALPGGLIKITERLYESALRLLKEETNVTNAFLEQLHTFSTLSRDKNGRVISTAYMALIPSEQQKLKTAERYNDVKWMEVKKVPKLAYDHNVILKRALKRLKIKLQHTNVVWSLLPKTFTLTELQKVYETVLDTKLDKRNFRKKILSLKIIENTKKKTKAVSHRPAVLYKFKSKKTTEIEMI